MGFVFFKILNCRTTRKDSRGSGRAIIDKVLPGPNPDMSPQVQEAVHIVNETIKNIVQDKSKKIVTDH
ncbi:MAG: hypothetical protein RL074_1214 [Bacteroidota bacterium]